MTIWFTSDPHYYHKGILSFCPQRAAAGWGLMTETEKVEAMNKSLIGNFNSKVQPDDDVYILGDFAFSGKEKKKGIIQQLNGRKKLVRGNHDGEKSEWWVEQGFEWVRDYYKLRVPDTYEGEDGVPIQYVQTIVLCHFPILSWDSMHHGTWHLHGHCHGSLPPTRMMRYDVGVDCNNLTPISYEEIKKIMVMRTIVPVDHHGL